MITRTLLFSALLVALPVAALADDGGSETGASEAGAGDAETDTGSTCKPASCIPYACGTDGSCKTTCATAADCNASFTCVGGNCVAPTATCSADGTSVVAADGTVSVCTPYSCFDGTCHAMCVRDGDCIGKNKCNVQSGRCEDPATAAAPADDSSGCAFGAKGSSGFAAALAVAALIARARKKSAS